MKTPTYNWGISDAEAGELPGIGGLAMRPKEDQASLDVLWGPADREKQAEDGILQPQAVSPPCAIIY